MDEAKLQLLQVTALARFELGFFSPGQSKSRYLGLWYRQSPDTVVWVANRDRPIFDHNRALTVSNKGNLVLLDQKNETTWSSNVSCDVKSPVAQLLDGGNLVVRDNSSTNTTKATFMYLQWICKIHLHRAMEWICLCRYESYNSPNIMILKLEHSGQLTRVIWNERRTAWDLMFSVPDKYCAKYGYCGANSICSLNQTPMCECLKGFQFQSQDNKTGSVNCKRSHSSDCKSGDQFTKLEDFKAPDLLEVSLNESMNLNQCQAECLKNCTCRAYANSKLRGGGSGC
ncbi:hypothetical protein CUMW_163460 [Citrus unshiu]|nr:hypothetical protein CUMW_163460 [Citrus unshiu]